MQEHRHPSEEDVASYLLEHTDFLIRREDVLSAITLPHGAGDAVSLLERQVSLLRERNREMRTRLGRLVDTARDNDLLFDKSKRMVLSILDARHWTELGQHVHRSLLDDFGVDFAQLTLFAPAGIYRGHGRVVSYEEAAVAIPGLLKSSKAVCGALRPHELDFLFPGSGREIGSAAVAPLRPGQPLGVLAIGARDPNHYRSSMGTLFLSYIAEVLERAIPRLPAE